jgi:hypothetical protein
MYWIRRIIKRFMVLIKIRQRKRNETTVAEWKARFIECKNRKSIIFQDLYVGLALKEINMSPEDKEIFYTKPSYKGLLRLSNRYRGVKIGDHPSIYRKPVNISR